MYCSCFVNSVETGMMYHEATKTWRHYDEVIRDPATWNENHVKSLQNVYQNFTPITICVIDEVNRFFKSIFIKLLCIYGCTHIN